MTESVALVRASRASWAAPVVTAVLAGILYSVLVGLRLGGDRSFATDPFGALALAGGAVGCALAAARLRSAGNRRAAAWTTALAASLLFYAGTAAWAVWAFPGGGAGAAVAVAIWNTAWIPPLALGQLAASAAIRTAGTRPVWQHAVLIAVVAAVSVANLAANQASAPFEGVRTIAPESWRTVLEPVGTVATVVGVLVLLLLPIALWRAALGSARPVRARLGVAAAGTSAAPLTVAFCLLLAVAGDPGDVDPSLGSVAFLVAIAAGSLLAVACATIAARGSVRAKHVLGVVRITGLATAALVVLAMGTVVASPALGVGPAVVALVIAALAVGLAAAAWFGTGALARALSASPPGERPTASTAPEPPSAPEPPGGLTAREAEVLELLAEGASNAGIAAQLVISERTVDAHLRAVFTKLDLATGSGTNRRVQAARIWLDHASAGR